MTTVLLGFAALAVDVGAMYMANSELQRAADATAMAAATKLSDLSTGDPMRLAREGAAEYACTNMVLGECAEISQYSDVVFGQVIFDGNSGKCTFQTGNNSHASIRVTVRWD